MAITGSTLTMWPGMTVVLDVRGYFAKQGEFKVINERTGETETKLLTNGFYVDDTDIGDIVAVEGRTSVVYTHKKAKENNVWFVALTEVDGEPERGVFRAVYVPVHDHGSLITGGPAHATYHSEGYRETTEEGE